MLDLKIEGAEVVDGTGRPGSRADVGIKDDKIAAMRSVPWPMSWITLSAVPLASNAFR